MGVEPCRVKAAMNGDESTATWICRRCGRPARVEKPQECPVCAGTSFQPVDKAAVAAAATREGGTVEEEAFDGFKVKWAAEAKAILNGCPKGHGRRRVKATIEKTARVRRLPSITRGFADANLDEAYGPVAEVVGDTLPAAPKPAGEAPLTWTDEAAARMERVPGGFMRMMARTKVEEFARKIRAEVITRDVVEGGLVDARMMMDQALKAHPPEVVEAAMKVHGHQDGNGAGPREPSPGWTEDGVRRLNEVEIRAEEKFEPARARELAEHAAESRAARTSEAINAAFLERLGIKIGYGHPLSPKTFEHRFTWTPEAEARLEKLPSYCRVVRAAGRPRANRGGKGVFDSKLRLAGGEVVGLMGPNGSGKTTLLRLRATAATPTSGQITWFGNSNPRDPSVRRRLGIMLDQPA